MKKVFLLLSFIFVCAITFAQTSNGVVDFVADTTTNSETEYLVISSPQIISKNYAVTMTVVPTNESGTATVTSVVQGSFNNTKWFDLASVADTVNNAGTAADKIYTYADAYFRYYRVKLVSTGTGVTSFTGQLGLKKKHYK